MTNVGRKRSFDRTEALDKAMRVFWDNGFSGTSLSDLTESLAINKPSLYAAFGNKAQLFNAALDHYLDRYGSPSVQLLTTPAELPILKRLENYLFAMAENNTAESTPKGCFIVKCHCESGGNQSLPKETVNLLENVSVNHETILENFFLSEQLKGNVSKAHAAKDIAAYLLSLMYGMSVMARRGKSSEALKSIVQTSLKTMPV